MHRHLPNVSTAMRQFGLDLKSCSDWRPSFFMANSRSTACPVPNSVHSFSAGDQREDALAVRGNCSTHRYETPANRRADSVNLVVTQDALELHAKHAARNPLSFCGDLALHLSGRFNGTGLPVSHLFSKEWHGSL
jgi:hypothetical protein